MNKASTIGVTLVGLLIIFFIFHFMKGSTVTVTQTNQAADATARDLVSPIINNQQSSVDIDAQK
jgi:hypothetical protein